MAQIPPPYGASTPPPQPYTQDSLSQQQTLPQSAVIPPSTIDNATDPVEPSSRRQYMLFFALGLAFVLAILLYFVWHTPSAPSTPSTITQQNFGSTSSNTNTSTSSNSGTTSGDMKVYVVGAVKHPGVYTLATGARVYQLLQAAGGPLPNANLVALNLAAKLSDGQEVYVTVVGEVPPTYMGGVPGPGTGNSGNIDSGQLVNINTASADEMRQSLHIGSTTAQNIVNYRSQHGSFTSIDQLLQVVSKSIYDRIKNQITV